MGILPASLGHHLADTALRRSEARPHRIGPGPGWLASSVAKGMRPRSLLAALAILCFLPEPVGQAYQVPPLRSPARPPRDQPRNPVTSTFGALSRCRPQLDERDRWDIAGAIHRESQRYGYDPLFVVAMVEVESTCLPTARSEDGAVGLIQMLPTTARALAEEAGLRWRGTRTLTTPTFNLHLGLRYLAQLEKQFRDPYVAIAAYNLGPTRVARMPRHRARRASYVKKVLSRYEAHLAADAAGHF